MCHAYFPFFFVSQMYKIGISYRIKNSGEKCENGYDLYFYVICFEIDMRREK